MAEKRIVWKIAIAAAILLALFLPGLSKYHQLKARQAKLNSGIDKLRILETNLRQEQARLKNDSIYIEKVARDKLQVTEKGETIVRIKRKDGK